MKNCPYCAEEIQESAVKCRYCGEWLDKEPPPHQTPAEPSEPPPAAALPTQTAAPAGPIIAANPSRLRGFGGWLWVFLASQFIPLLQVMGRSESLSYILSNASSLTLFLLGWNVLGVLVALALAFPPHNSALGWMVRGFIIANIGILVAVTVLYWDAAVLGSVIPPLTFSVIWLIYFFVSKRVRLTYFNAAADA